MRLKVRLSALVAQLQLIVRLSGPSSSSTEKEAHEGIREGERHSMCSCSIGDVAGRLGRKLFDELGRTRPSVRKPSLFAPQTSMELVRPLVFEALFHHGVCRLHKCSRHPTTEHLQESTARQKCQVGPCQMYVR